MINLYIFRQKDFRMLNKKNNLTPTNITASQNRFKQILNHHLASSEDEGLKSERMRMFQQTRSRFDTPEKIILAGNYLKFMCEALNFLASNNIVELKTLIHEQNNILPLEDLSESIAACCASLSSVRKKTITTLEQLLSQKIDVLINQSTLEFTSLEKRGSTQWFTPCQNSKWLGQNNSIYAQSIQNTHQISLNDLIFINSQMHIFQQYESKINQKYNNLKLNNAGEDGANDLGISLDTLLPLSIKCLVMALDELRCIAYFDGMSADMVFKSLKKIAALYPTDFVKYVKILGNLIHRVCGILSYISAGIKPANENNLKYIDELQKLLSQFKWIVSGVNILTHEFDLLNLNNNHLEEIYLIEPKNATLLAVSLQKLASSLGVEHIDLNKFECYGVGNEVIPSKKDHLNLLTKTFSGANPLLWRISGAIICQEISLNDLNNNQPYIASFSKGGLTNLSTLHNKFKNTQQITNLQKHFRLAFVNTDPESGDNRYGFLTGLSQADPTSRMSTILGSMLKNKELQQAFERYKKTYNLNDEQARHSQLGIILIPKILLQ